MISQLGFRKYRALAVAAPEAHALLHVIVLDALLKGKGLQALVRILYQMLDTTRNVAS